ncbi:MAG TPA: hypothetical protein VN028_08525 [Rhodocyclaceae bacterium]|nr:hypothetical protein [Rhodocyclaceae bacterium]
MRAPDNPLVRHLLIALLVKLLLLGALWWFFVRDLVVHPDPSVVAAHIDSAPMPAAATSAAAQTDSPSSLQGARP